MEHRCRPDDTYVPSVLLRVARRLAGRLAGPPS
jgi:hypothetical protein